MRGADVALPCRTCGRPRGENIAEGTRCAACGRRQAIVMTLSVATATAAVALSSSRDVATAAGVLAAAAVATPAAFVTAVLWHELAHAAAAMALGQTVTRVIVGEGSRLWSLGTDPQLVIGTVVLGNGFTTVMDLRPDGYRLRMAVTLLAGPAASAAAAFVSYVLAPESPVPISVAARLFAWANAALATVTLIPVPTFGGRVWSDLAVTLFIVRASDATLEQHRLDAARERMEILSDNGQHERGVETARLAAAGSGSPLAPSLLACMLHRAGHLEEASEVARQALVGEIPEADRAYLRQFLRAGSPRPEARGLKPEA